MSEIYGRYSMDQGDPRTDRTDGGMDDTFLTPIQFSGSKFSSRNLQHLNTIPSILNWSAAGNNSCTFSAVMHTSLLYAYSENANYKYEMPKVGCVFPMVNVSILPQARFGPSDPREDAPHFTISPYLIKCQAFHLLFLVI